MIALPPFSPGFVIVRSTRLDVIKLLADTIGAFGVYMYIPGRVPSRSQRILIAHTGDGVIAWHKTVIDHIPELFDASATMARAEYPGTFIADDMIFPDVVVFVK